MKRLAIIWMAIILLFSLSSGFSVSAAESVTLYSTLSGDAGIRNMVTQGGTIGSQKFQLAFNSEVYIERVIILGSSDYINFVPSLSIGGMVVDNSVSKYSHMNSITIRGDGIEMDPPVDGCDAVFSYRLDMSFKPGYYTFTIEENKSAYTSRNNKGEVLFGIIGWVVGTSDGAEKDRVEPERRMRAFSVKGWIVQGVSTSYCSRTAVYGSVRTVV